MTKSIARSHILIWLDLICQLKLYKIAHRQANSFSESSWPARSRLEPVAAIEVKSSLYGGRLEVWRGFMICDLI